MTLEQFGKLFMALRQNLADLFPRCPEILRDGEMSFYCSRRMKLFLVLFRCRQGSSFAHMEACFGWSHAVLEDDYKVIMTLLRRNLYNFHEGFLKYRGKMWQYQEIMHWRRRHAENLNMFHDKVRCQNEYSARHHTFTTIDDNLITAMEGGSIGAFDCTYSVRP